MEGLLLTAALLACPLGMGLMMWFMTRGQKKPPADAQARSVSELRAEQQRLDAAIAEAEARRTPATGQRL